MVGRNHELEELARYLEENTTIAWSRAGLTGSCLGSGHWQIHLAQVMYYRYQQRYAKVKWRNLGKDPHIAAMVGTIAAVVSFDTREVLRTTRQCC